MERQISDTTFERHYKIVELMGMWGWSYATIQRRIKNEPGVLRRPYRVPESVVRRIHLKHTNK